jgi:hypothetical protein
MAGQKMSSKKGGMKWSEWWHKEDLALFNVF